MTSDQILMKASKTQDESVQALDRMLVTLEGTKEVRPLPLLYINRIQVGAETAKHNGPTDGPTQSRGRRRIGGEDDLHANMIWCDNLQVQNNLKEANKLLRAFARRVATDKILMGFMCLLVLAIVALIVVKIVKKKTSGGGGLVT